MNYELLKNRDAVLPVSSIFHAAFVLSPGLYAILFTTLQNHIESGKTV